MGMYFNKDDGDAMIEGVIKGRVAVRRKSGRIEVWDDEYECHYGTLPVADWTLTQINAAIEMHALGLAAGAKSGARNAQHEIRKALGIDG